MGNICLSRKEWHPDTLQKPKNRQQMAAIFIHQWLAWTPFWLTSVNGLIICPVLSDLCIYLKLRKLHTWWQLFFKLPNKNKASKQHSIPRHFAVHRLCLFLLSRGQNGDIHAQLKGPGFSVGFWLSATSLTEVQRDQQPDDSAPTKNAENSSILILCTYN